MMSIKIIAMIANVKTQMPEAHVVHDVLKLHQHHLLSIVFLMNRLLQNNAPRLVEWLTVSENLQHPTVEKHVPNMNVKHVMANVQPLLCAFGMGAHGEHNHQLFGELTDGAQIRLKMMKPLLLFDYIELMKINRQLTISMQKQKKILQFKNSLRTYLYHFITYVKKSKPKKDTYMIILIFFRSWISKLFNPHDQPDVMFIWNYST